MGSPEGRFNEFLGAVKSWMPRRSETTPQAAQPQPQPPPPQLQPHDLSRDFWMPDQSCRVCYDCDAQFTIINRRHHCRHCGRVFCSKCTSNFVPRAPSDTGGSPREDGERIRLCNYCFKRWQEEVAAAAAAAAAAAKDAGQPSSPVLSPSLSTTSVGSSKSSSTVNSSAGANGQISFASVAYPDFGSGIGHVDRVEPASEKQDIPEPVRNMEPTACAENPCDHFGFCLNGSDDEDDDYGVFRSDSEAKHSQNSDGLYGHARFDYCQDYQSDKEHPVERVGDAKDPCSPLHERPTLNASNNADKIEENRSYNSDECDPPSSLYSIEGIESEPVDFENNGLLWLPPEPENEEDERDVVLYDDDEGEDATGEWGYLRSSNSFGSSHYRSRDRSAEEHKIAMKNIVDGHFRALVAQLLQADNLVSEKVGKENWLDIVTSLSWEAASLLKPDTSKGGGMDPGGYVKVKCLACGRPSDSFVVKGIVCKKNVAHRRMALKKEKPRILILGGALEYQRISNLLSSFDTLLHQETDYLKMAVAKIQVHQPNVVLVERSVSRYAQDLFLEKNISLVLNIKRQLLERISRCTGAQIVPSIDQLSSQKLGYCDSFHVEKVLEEHGSAGECGKKLLKTLMFFEGCPKPLGCTILLKGANGDELKKVKHVVQYGVFAAYHLALETSFLADEGATLPELPLKSPIFVALPDKASGVDRSISTIPVLQMPGGPSQCKSLQTPDMRDRQLTVGGLQKKEPMVSTSPLRINNFPRSESTPTSTTSCVSSENSVKMNNQNRDVVCAPNSTTPYVHCSVLQLNASPCCSPYTNDVSSRVGFAELQSETTAVAQVQDCDISSTCPMSVESVESFRSLSHNSELDEKKVADEHPASFNLKISHQDDDSKSSSDFPKDEFPPSPADNQSILVSLSSRCVWKGTVCERAHLFRIKYYGSFDKPLGRYLRDHLFDQSYLCRSCELQSEAHVYCYTHPQGSLTISVRTLPDELPGEHDGKIWMWHRCLRCPRVNGLPPATKRVVMSDAAWGLSFGKFLELSFSNHAAASRVASCGHSLHRDCLRFYGFGRMVACFRYASINVHSVYLPPSKLDFSTQHHEWAEKEANEVADYAELLFTEVLNALRQICERMPITGSFDGNMKILESRRNVRELEELLQVEKLEFVESLNRLMKKETRRGQPFIDILEVNKLQRQLLFLCYLWDQRLVFVAASCNKCREALGSFHAGVKEKVDFNEKMVDCNATTNLEKSIMGSETNSNLKDEYFNQSSNPPHGEEGLNQIDQTSENNLNGSEQHKADKIFPKVDHASNANVKDQVALPEPDVGVRRVLSDGQCPVIADISDTLDAKWRGENGPSFSDASVPKPLVLLEAAAADVQNQVEAIPSFFSSSPVRWGDTVEDLASWLKMPFMTIYNCLNKNTGNAPRFDALADYSPVYVLLFRELARQNGARLFLPIGVNDTVIPVFDDEPTSIISYALVSPIYHFQMSDEGAKPRDGADSSLPLPVYDSGNFNPFHLFEDFGSNDDFASSMSGSRGSFVADPVHLRVSFADSGALGKVKYTVTCYYAKSFESLRRSCCPSELDFIRSLSRCKKWGAQGGKSNVFFAKTLDDRFIIKQVTRTELESFIKFGPDYFKYLSESISTGSPTCLAKILGIYQVAIKYVKGGKESRMDLLVMENLLFGRNVTRLYDLKGSSRSRYNADSSGNNKVLLDQNLIEAMPTSPIFVGNKAKRVLERAVWNDTAFLAGIDVMDYSLLVGVDEEKHELVLGIIDFMRQYTWDKHLETWAKSSGILGGPKNASPTVISPKQYKKRFRKAMSAYFIVVPDQWPHSSTIPSKSVSDLCQDDQTAFQYKP